ncbi:MAG: DNA-binding response OmpR family regulator [Acidimicrobiales bacterium]|jgi:DNA-binding response OmpR family regulator
MNKLILIIEDEMDMREAEASALEANGFTVLMAENGEMGLRMAIENKPDLILLDLLMPIMGGQEMLQKLRNDPWGNTAKVIMTTALDDVENIGLGFEKGIDDYIIKSSASLADIVEKVKQVLVR